MRILLQFVGKFAALVVEALVRLYQIALSPLLIGSCKFYPTCSEYCLQAVREWGVLRGGWMAIKRILRCTPWGMGGIDPVPKRDPH